ncbi:Uncharacterised protein [Mycobacterium tuberculosis]|nr:Uncharacterised protein [Mycobacterium tuberculosis]
MGLVRNTVSVTSSGTTTCGIGRRTTNCAASGSNHQLNSAALVVLPGTSMAPPM